jgi:hypothetical protein
MTTKEIDARLKILKGARGYLYWLLRVLEELEAQDRDGHTKA